LITPIELTRLVLPEMLDRGYGRIINISAIAGRVGFPLTEAYAAGKDGLIAFSRVLRTDYRSAGISASAIVLGAVKDAGLGQRTLDEIGLEANTAFMVKPEKVAKAVVRAIERDKPETVVMRGPGRLLKALMDLFPALGETMNRMSGAEKLMGRSPTTAKRCTRGAWRPNRVSEARVRARVAAPGRRAGSRRASDRCSGRRPRASRERARRVR
jgi:hypothetical protein